jgi:DNA-binding CsgD family transcriptional regulator
MEDPQYQKLYLRPDELAMYNHCLIFVRWGIALKHVIDLCMQDLKPLDEDSIFAEAYWTLCDYLWQRHKWDCSGSINIEEIRSHRSSVSTATYYNRLNLGMMMLAQHISLFLERFTGHLEPVHLLVPTRRVLSPKELEVLRLVAQGISGTQDVADRLYVSKATVVTYWKRIRAKLGAKNRAEALIIASRLNLVKL